MWTYFEEKVGALLDRARNEPGMPEVDIFMSDRSWPQQDALYALGRTVKNPDGASESTPMGRLVTKAKGGESWHNYGVAADLVFHPDGKWSWDDKLPYAKLGQMGIDLGLEWGGVWKFKDPPHFQIRGTLTIQEAQEIYLKGGVKMVWDEIARRIATEPFVHG